MTMQAYAQLIRFDKPVGTWLTFWPAAWAVVVASPNLPHHDLALYGLLLLGAFFMRSAGCIINDIADRKFDGRVARTKTRPLAAGTLSLRAALLLLTLMLVGALLVLLSLPHRPIWLALALLPLVALYPLMKRITFWPQAFLGVVFNTGVFFGWVAASGGLGLGAMWLYIAAVFWTLAYDTIYAIQDRADDEKIGVKSTARLLGGFAPAFAFVCYAHTVFLISWVGYEAGYGVAYMLGILAVIAHMAWQWRLLEKTPAAHGRVFRSNGWLGAIVFIGFFAARYTV